MPEKLNPASAAGYLQHIKPSMENIRITQFLRDHHKTIRGLMAQAEAAPARAPEMENDINQMLLDQLECHCRFGEKTLYLELQSLKEAIRPLIDESREGLDEIKTAVQQARASLSQSRHAEFRERLDNIRSLFEIHVADEEGKILTFADKTLDPKLLEQMARPLHREVPIQAPHGGEQRRKLS